MSGDDTEIVLDGDNSEPKAEENAVEIVTGAENGIARPGARLRGSFCVKKEMRADKAEVFVFWYSDGKGESETGLLMHEELSDLQLGPERVYPFEVTLPQGPWSYHGKLVNIHWAVRVEVRGSADSWVGVGEKEFEVRPERKA